MKNYYFASFVVAVLRAALRSEFVFRACHKINSIDFIFGLCCPLHTCCESVGW